MAQLVWRWSCQRWQTAGGGSNPCWSTWESQVRPAERQRARTTKKLRANAETLLLYIANFERTCNFFSKLTTLLFHQIARDLIRHNFSNASLASLHTMILQSEIIILQHPHTHTRSLRNCNSFNNVFTLQKLALWSLFSGGNGGMQDLSRKPAQGKVAFGRLSLQRRVCFFGPKKRKLQMQMRASPSRSLGMKTAGVRTTFASLLEVQMSLRFSTPHYRTLLHYTPVHYITLHYDPVHSTTLNYTTPHYITLHYAPLHYTTLHHITLHYTPLHYITLYYSIFHYTTFHYTTPTTTTTTTQQPPSRLSWYGVTLVALTDCRWWFDSPLVREQDSRP